MIQLLLILETLVLAGIALYHGRWISFVLLFPLLATYHLSGIVHLTYPNDIIGGFAHYEWLPQDSQLDVVLIGLVVTAAMALGTIAIIPNAGIVASDNRPNLPKFVTVYGALISVLAVTALIVVLGERGGDIISEIGNIDRDWEIGTGMARHYFVAQWLPTGLTMLSLPRLMHDGNSARNRILVVGILCCSLTTFWWTGGRSALLMSLLPTALLLFRVNRELFKVAASTIAALVVIFMTTATLARMNLEVGDSLVPTFLSLLDWQIGRFSTLATVGDLVHAQGYLFGQTLLHWPAKCFELVQFVIPGTPVMDTPRSITSYVGELILGDPTINGIVPGALFELYANFGYIGIVLGSVLYLGVSKGFARVALSSSSISACMAAGTYLVYVLITFWAGSTLEWIYRGTIAAAPLGGLWLLERLILKHESREIAV